MKKNLLLIPHAPLVKTGRTRGQELASQLSKHFNVYFLSWYYNPLQSSSKWRRAGSRVYGLLKKTETFEYCGYQVVSPPFFYVRRIKSSFVKKFNTMMINKVIKKYNIDLVVNELGIVNSSKFSAPYFLDLVDLPHEEALQSWKEQAGKAQGVISITVSIQNELKKLGIESGIVGNGADVKRFRKARGEKIREKYNFGKKFVIGYVGNHAMWSGLPFLLDVFKEVKKKVPESVLFIVGPGSEVPAAKSKVEKENIKDVIFTGPVDASEVADYFKAIDLSVLPFKRMPFTDFAFPIKIVEYAAAKKLTLATPLTELRNVKLSNLFLVDEDIRKWTDKIIELKKKKWQKKWDKEVEAYSWEKLASKMAGIINKKAEQG